MLGGSFSPKLMFTQKSFEGKRNVFSNYKLKQMRDFCIVSLLMEKIDWAALGGVGRDLARAGVMKIWACFNL
jgi:hypothetical protein